MRIGMVRPMQTPSAFCYITTVLPKPEIAISAYVVLGERRPVWTCVRELPWSHHVQPFDRCLRKR